MQQMKLRWMKRAVKHLDTIYDFLAKKNEQAAIKVYNEFLDTADTLLTFPYKLIYRIEKNIIKIVAVWDCRQNPKKLKRII